MSLRTNDLEIKKLIAKMSIKGGQESRKARNLFILEMDENKRLEFMRISIKQKFDNNLDIKELLLNTNEEIIEKNYWNDLFFGVDDKTLKGANILGKLLMEYRDNCKGIIKGIIL